MLMYSVKYSAVLAGQIKKKKMSAYLCFGSIKGQLISKFLEMRRLCCFHLQALSTPLFSENMENALRICSYRLSS